MVVYIIYIYILILSLLNVYLTSLSKDDRKCELTTNDYADRGFVMPTGNGDIMPVNPVKEQAKGEIMATSLASPATFVNAGVNLANGIITNANQAAMQQNAIAAQNNWNQESIKFQQNENNIIRSREDMAFQRAVADAVSAGLSPLAVKDGAQTNLTVSPMAGTSSNAGIITDFANMRSNAFQSAMSGMSNSLMQGEKNRIEEKSIDNAKGYQDKMLELEESAQTLEDKRFYANLRQDAENLEKSLKNAKDINDANNKVTEHVAMARIKADYNLQTNEQIFEDEQARKRYHETLETMRRENAFKSYIHQQDLDFNRRKVVSDAFNGIVNSMIHSVGNSLIGRH